MKAIVNAVNQLVLMSETLQEDIVLQTFLSKDMQPLQIIPFQLTMEQMQPPVEDGVCLPDDESKNPEPEMLTV